jgi:hypothetical protein
MKRSFWLCFLKRDSNVHVVNAVAVGSSSAAQFVKKHLQHKSDGGGETVSFVEQKP